MFKKEPYASYQKVALVLTFVWFVFWMILPTVVSAQTYSVDPTTIASTTSATYDTDDGISDTLVWYDPSGGRTKLASVTFPMSVNLLGDVLCAPDSAFDCTLNGVVRVFFNTLSDCGGFDADQCAEFSANGEVDITLDNDTGGGGGGGDEGTTTPPLFDANRTIRFETFQLLSFILTASFFLWLAISLTAWFINRNFSEP